MLVSGLEVDRPRMKKAASDPLLLATDAAEALVREGVPFRDAHEQVDESGLDVVARRDLAASRSHEAHHNGSPNARV